MEAFRIGLVLGSGSARGWAHIGVIRALAEAGIKPDIVCGSSIGAVVGAAYVSGNLALLEQWVRTLTFWDVARLLDVRMKGGLIEGVTLMESFRDKIRDVNIEQLSLPFAAVATDLGNGHEMWLQQGPLLPAVRASLALPGLFSPTRINGRWLVDGGLVNPVPISLCRAMGADFIIAVNLNSDIVGRHLAPRQPRPAAVEEEGRRDLFEQVLKQLNNGLRERALNAWRRERIDGDEPPGLFEVLASSINIMQDRITKSRMAGDPPDVLLSPQLGQLGLLEFDRAGEAIAEGMDCVKRQLPQLQQALARKSNEGTEKA
jgi:NTE family protein